MGTEPVEGVSGARHSSFGPVEIDVGTVGDARIKRLIYPPGMRWSSDIKPLVGRAVRTRARRIPRRRSIALRVRRRMHARLRRTCGGRSGSRARRVGRRRRTCRLDRGRLRGRHARPPRFARRSPARLIRSGLRFGAPLRACRPVARAGDDGEVVLYRVNVRWVTPLGVETASTSGRAFSVSGCSGPRSRHPVHV